MQVPFVNMTSRAAQVVPGTPLGERLLDAILAEGWTLERLTDELVISKGHLGRIIRGERWKDTVDIELAKKLAAKLHVNFLWLVLGEGPRRREGRPETPAEEAFAFCRRNGTREDAIQAAWERNKDREAEMSVQDWVLAVWNEATRLNAANVPRPEVIVGKQRELKRASSKKRRQKKAAELEAAKPIPLLPAKTGAA